MKYETRIKDKYGNVAYDWVKVCNDMKRVIQGKIKFSEALYHVMMQRFTIAHYDRYGWFNTYNGNWEELASQISPWKACTGDLSISKEEEVAIYELTTFLKFNSNKTLDEEKAL